MQFLPSFLLIFSLIVSFNVKLSMAIECRINDQDPSKVAYTITVDQSGQGKYNKIQDAIDSIPSQNDQWIRIHARAGIYTEKVNIPPDKQCIVLEGEGSGVTTITWGDHDSTDSSATFSSMADNFVAKAITFKNNYNHAMNLNLVDVSTEIKQAVATRIFGDKSAFYDCGFIGFQDTLWDGQGRHYFKTCNIEGAIDFIFGTGQSYYESCVINVLANIPAPQISTAYITAQDRKAANDPNGFVFSQCTVSGGGQAYLGRAYGPYSRVIFERTQFDVMIVPEGWDAWNFKGQEGNLVYAEVNCQGKGYDVSKRVPWEKQLSVSDLGQFTISAFVDQEGWIAKQP